ncbi:MAG: hypothetical protein K940chlam2_01715 [Chlamydiae bacterium]|nr:hypothetical protein [Chlamydiota bacterium]
MALAKPKLWKCVSCLDRDAELFFHSYKDHLESDRLNEQKNKLEKGTPRNKKVVSLRCVADPANAYLGSYFYRVELTKSLLDGVMPSGSLWLNDHDRRVYEVLGEIGKIQELYIVSKKRLKLMEARFPRLRRAISNPTVC